MNLILKRIIIVCSLLVTQMSFAANEIRSVYFKDLSSSGELTLNLDEKISSLPNLQVKNNAISFVLINTVLTASQVPDSISFATKTTKDTLIDINQDNMNTIVNIRFPFNMEKKEDRIKVNQLGSRIVLSFPKVRIPEPTKAVQKKEAKSYSKTAEKLDESYLDDLLNDEKSKLAVAKVANTKNKVADKPKTDFFGKDEIATKKASTKKQESNFSFVGYAGKFIAFLGGVLLLFYFIVNLFKKGVISRGKMGFLNNTNLVQVLSTTYIAPKKSLMLVKAHNQVFLVSSTDQGMSFLSEINDTTDLFKQGEKEITGTNFDQDLDATDTEHVEDRILLKDDITKSTPVANNNKFSEHLKNKVKGLRPLN